MPGSRILSVGFYGCNLRCPFCQNYEISWSEKAFADARQGRIVSSEELADLAETLKERGNIGVAFTYNEPLTSYEFVRDTAKYIHERGMKTVLVTNGTADEKVLREILPWIDAMNIDLKGFSGRYYEKVLGGNLQQVLHFIEISVKSCHVELTTLIVPGENDSEEEMRRMSSWISALTDSQGIRIGRNIPLHISRFFPLFHMKDRSATDVKLIYRLADIARERLKYVYTGNC
jgi:pyruvate formate lyase activating enzyme